jgi:hypothetical protein
MPSKFFVMDFRKKAKDLKDLVGLTKLNASLKEKTKEFRDELSSRIQDLDVKTFIIEISSLDLDVLSISTSSLPREENRKISKISHVQNSDNLTPPKRLFDINLMKTVMYEDIVDDVKEKGYVAVSHVWGDSKDWTWSTAKQMGITGLDWKVPLSNLNKMNQIKRAMETFGKEYCWLDVLCMPQGEDRQWEVNLEIPFMGDYYAGADMVLVLATVDPVISEDFTKWYNLMDDVMENKRNFTKKEVKWLYPNPMVNLLDMSGEKWFTRLWTLQEAIMAKNLILVHTFYSGIQHFIY